MTRRSPAAIRRPYGPALAALWLLMVVGLPARAQDTRSGLIEQEIAAKAARLRPPEPQGLERLMVYVEEHNLVQRLSAKPDGWYPRLGGMTTGSGLALGPGYRRQVGRDGLFDVSAAGSLKSYRAAEATVALPSFAGQRLAVELGAAYRHYPQERFFGLGASSSSDDRVSYLYEDVTATAGVVFWPGAPLRGGVRIGYTAPELGRGSGPFPSIETRFAPPDTPGLTHAPDYLITEGYVEADDRDFPGNPRSGGRYRLALSAFADRGAHALSFRRLDAEAMRLFPFFDKRRVIALRALVALTDATDGNDVPFYLMPFVGGPETLRGFRERRFTDRNLLLLNAEYRYEIFAALDMALFVDAGTVGPRVEDLRLGSLTTDYGVGFRFGTRSDLILRFDIGLGGEGPRYFVKFGPVF